MLAAQRVVPYTRVWLFLVPLAAATTAGFYGWLLERRAWALAPGRRIAVAVAVAGSLLVLAADSVRESRETGALLDAPAIAAFLAERVEPEDRILATGSDTILEYYLERDGIDAGSAPLHDEPSARTYVVVNTLGGQTIDDLLAQLQTPWGAGTHRSSSGASSRDGCTSCSALPEQARSRRAASTVSQTRSGTIGASILGYAETSAWSPKAVAASSAKTPVSGGSVRRRGTSTSAQNTAAPSRIAFGSA